MKIAKEAYLYDSNDAAYKVIAMGKDLDLTIFEEERYGSFMRVFSSVDKDF